jgi:hypothetical protein
LFVLQAIVRPVSTVPLASRVTAESRNVSPTCKLDEDGETETDDTGGGAGALTVIVADALFPSLAAETCTVPAATAVTRPEDDTEAMLAFAELQTTVRPVNTLLLASRVVADNCDVPLTAMATLVGETAIDATGIGGGTDTVNVARPVWPSLTAEIVAVPAAIAVTSPVATTDATLASELCQVTLRPPSVFPLESRSVAVATAFAPTRTDAGAIAT